MSRSRFGVFAFPGGMVDWLNNHNASGWLNAPLAVTRGVDSVSAALGVKAVRTGLAPAIREVCGGGRRLRVASMRREGESGSSCLFVFFVVKMTAPQRTRRNTRAIGPYERRAKGVEDAVTIGALHEGDRAARSRGPLKIAKALSGRDADVARGPEACETEASEAEQHHCPSRQAQGLRTH